MSKPGPTKPRIVKREDGLTVMHGKTKPCKWWCSHCVGMKPARWQVQRITSLNEVFTGWDIHKRSPTHQHHNSLAAHIEHMTSGTP